MTCRRFLAQRIFDISLKFLLGVASALDSLHMKLEVADVVHLVVAQAVLLALQFVGLNQRISLNYCLNFFLEL